MLLRAVIASIAGVFLCISYAPAQFKEGGGDVKPGGATLGDKSQTFRWKAGFEIRAMGGECKNVHGYIPIPYSWPEQEVTIIKDGETISPEIKISYKTIDNGVRIMNFQIPRLGAGKEAKAVITFEIRRSIVLPPEDTAGYVFPDLKKLPPGIREYLSPSPMIESNDPKIRELAKTLGADKEKAWDRIEAIFDWIREHVQYKQGCPLRGAVVALREKNGDCEDMTSLFIAICRAASIPARTVWVHNHCYPEFYLNDANGEGHWFPCNIASAGREFGGVSDLRPIFQKGDNFRPPSGSKKRQRYMAEYITGTGRPQVKWIREPIAK